MPYKPDILIIKLSDSPEENVLTLCRVSRILLLPISRGKDTSLYGLYRDVPLDKVLYVQRQDFDSPVESIKQQTDPYGRATNKKIKEETKKYIFKQICSIFRFERQTFFED